MGQGRIDPEILAIGCREGTTSGRQDRPLQRTRAAEAGVHAATKDGRVDVEEEREAAVKTREPRQLNRLRGLGWTAFGFRLERFGTEVGCLSIDHQPQRQHA